MLPNLYNLALSLADFNWREEKANRKLCFDAAMAKIQAEGFDVVANRNVTLIIFDWVISSGGKNGRYWDEIVAFGTRYCGQRNRKLPAEMYDLSARAFKSGLSRLGLAIWRASWLTEPREDGTVKGLQAAKIKQLFEKGSPHFETGAKVNEVLVHLHDTSKGFLARESPRASGGDGSRRNLRARRGRPDGYRHQNLGRRVK